MTAYDVVIPTLGRPSLTACLEALAAGPGPLPEVVLLVDDRPLTDCTPLDVRVPEPLRDRVEVLAGCGRGPAAARNTGWRAAEAPWTVFLDDDVLPGPAWRERLAADLADAAPRTAGVQGRIDVPLPQDRRPTDWERSTAGLAGARWITADMAYRREALARVGGFDERFPRAFREDADLALRILDAGWELTRGTRRTTHPVRPQPGRWASVRAQAGNRDDVRMTRLHGRDWRRRAGERRGRLPGHLATTAALAAGTLAAVRGRPGAAAGWAVLWAALTAEFCATRVRPGPRTREEITTMVLSSAALPPAAAWHWLRGLLDDPRPPAWGPPPEPAPAASGAARADHRVWEPVSRTTAAP